MTGFDPGTSYFLDAVKEEMHEIPRSPSVFSYVMGVYECGGKSLGETAARARLFESWNAGIGEQNAKGEVGGDVT